MKTATHFQLNVYPFAFKDIRQLSISLTLISQSTSCAKNMVLTCVYFHVSIYISAPAGSDFVSLKDLKIYFEIHVHVLIVLDKLRLSDIESRLYKLSDIPCKRTLQLLGREINEIKKSALKFVLVVCSKLLTA